MWRSPLALRSSRGFSLIEVIAALAILSVAIVALVELYTSSLRTTGKSYMHTMGTVYARSMMEEALATNDMDTLMEVDMDLGGGFRGSRSAEEIPADALALSVPAEDGEAEELLPMDDGKTYLITVTVNWPPSGGMTLRSHKTVFSEEGDAASED